MEDAERRPEPREETSTIYQPVEESPFATPFWDFYKVLWEAEARFDLVFRKDNGVAVWTANRVRIYYDLARQLGLYDAQEAPEPAAAAAAEAPALAPLGPVDVYIQSGAIGPAAANRARPLGCVYTEPTITRLLDGNARVLLVHDAPQAMTSHPNLKVITSKELRARARAASGNARAPSVVFDEATRAFWGEVDAFFRAELGVAVPDVATLQKHVASHRQQFVWHKAFLAELSPNVFICMAHYFRAPQIEAARRLGIRAIDYQHGINSRYHLGYGYPNVRPEARRVPYFPDEFWSWGEAWTDPKWFPEIACGIRLTGHPSLAGTASGPAVDARPERTVLITTSWAMRSAFREAIVNIAARHPDWTVRVKLHPRERIEHYSDITELHPNVEVLSGELDVVEVARSVRYVVSICSTSLFDVLFAGCRIAVLRSPSVEYAEDFVARFGVPVIEPDGSNFLEAVAAMQLQNVPLDSVFHGPSKTEMDLLSESLAIERELVWVPPAERKPEAVPRQEQRLGWLGRQLSRHLPSVAARLSRPGPGTRAAPDPLREEPGDGGSPLRAATRLAEEIAAGENPARRAADIRSALSALGQGEEDLAAAARLLAAVEADDHAAAALLRAELFEARLVNAELMSASGSGLEAKAGGPQMAHRAPSDGHGHDRMWTEGLQRLGRLSPGLKTFARRYAAMAGAAEAEFGDSRVDAGDQARLRDALGRRLRDPAPFSMLRIGDGEVYAFDPDYVPAATLEEDRKARELIWWQRTLDDDLRARMRVLAVEAICAADFLGVPSAYRLLRDLPRLLPKMRGPIATWPRTARAHRIIFEELERLSDTGRLDWSGKTLIDDRCHQELFTPEGLGAFEVPGRPRIFVNCFPHEQANAALGRDFFTGGLRLPPHAKVRSYVPDDALAQAATPDLLDDLMAQVGAHAAAGAVLFVAGGFVGKILIGHARASGGAALDIGAAADYWMGYETRGPLDFRKFRADGRRAPRDGQQ